MTAVRPFEILHVPARLRADFETRLPPAQTGDQVQREQNFLSRALAAFAIHQLAGATLDDSAASVVDGGNDGGIDAIHFDAPSTTLWIVQSKFIANGAGQPELGDVSKFCDGTTALLHGDFATFSRNAAWLAKIPSLQHQLGRPGLRVRCVLIYSGLSLVAEDRLRLIDSVKRRFNRDDDFVAFTICNLTTIHDWVTGADQGLGVEEVALEVLNPGWVRQPYETIFGLVRVDDLAQLNRTYGDRLVAANIRRYRGSTDVNDRITATLRAEPHHFFYLNNGLTAYCERLEVHNLDRDDATRKRVTARGFAIVNGAQTLGSVGVACPAAAAAPNGGLVFLKIISLERCENEEEFARRITECTNFQNRIGAKDFVALDEQQRRLAEHLALSGITYHFKDGEDSVSPDDTNFTLTEATTALACLEQDNTCDLIARVLSNRPSLWDNEATVDAPSRYSRLFRADLSARTVWRVVQAQRVVIERMQAEGRTANGIRKAFFENARWVVLNILLLKLHPERGEDLPLTEGERAALSEKTLVVAEELWNASQRLGLVTRRAENQGGDPFQQVRHFRSVFCDGEDCRRLRGAALAEIAAKGNV